MRSLTEDQEAANEELQTANEEIVSRNEELQSMNEELETAKEEAEASNEELTTVNDELRSRNEEVSQAREFADAIIRTIPVPLLVLDGELRVTSLNRAFCDTFRVDEKETAGQLLYQLGNGQWDIPSLRELLSDILPKDKSLHGYVIEHDFPSIGRKTMRLSGRKFERGGQQILLIIEDVTEERAQIQQRIDLEKKNAVMAEEQIQLKQLSDSKDEFISLASHQLRTPATVVKQFLGMVLEGYKGRVAKQQREFLAAAYDSNDQQLKIISDLLQIARIDQGQIQLDASRRDIGALLRDTIAAQRPVFREHGQTIHFEPPPRKIHASVDPTLMRSAIDNILDNASKYSAAGAAVEVSLVRRPGAVAAISIADHGSGIYKKDLGRLFEKFSQAGSDSNASGGSGLGLYWARQITSLHGGDIEVSSRKNRGSTFTITFPAE
jgi:two-component system CheB/CheR fusion protein